MPAARGKGLTRRHALYCGAAAGAALLLTRRPVVAAVSMEEAIAGLLVGRKATPSSRLGIEVPQAFNYGITVPLGIAVDSPMTREDHVRSVHVFADGNPFPEVVSLHFAPENGPARVSTRFRLDSGKHLIWAAAELSDGSVLTATSEVSVVIGGCDKDSGIAPNTPEPQPVPRVKLPERAGRGDLVEVHSHILHRMETGLRADTAGNLLPRRIIHRMECHYAGRVVFAAELSPAIAANAYFGFPMRAVEEGDVAFAWHEDGGAVYRATQHIAVD